MQYHPICNQPAVKNKFAKASLVLSLIAIGFLVLAVVCFIIGFIMISMAGQSPMASGVDIDDPYALEVYGRESIRLRFMGLMLINIPPMISGMFGILALVFGIIGVMKPIKRGLAISGIMISVVPICTGVLALLFGGLLRI